MKRAEKRDSGREQGAKRKGEDEENQRAKDREENAAHESSNVEQLSIRVHIRPLSRIIH